MMSDTPLRRLPVDLGEIEVFAAEHDSYGENLTAAYVDTVSGQVHIVSTDVLRAVEDDVHPKDLPKWQADEFAVAELIVPDTEERFVEVERWESDEEFELMEEFAAAAETPGLREGLLEALRRRKPFRQFKDALFAWPEAREAWFAYQEFRHRERLRKWLEGLGIDPIDVSVPPPRPRPERW